MAEPSSISSGPLPTPEGDSMRSPTPGDSMRSPTPGDSMASPTPPVSPPSTTPSEPTRVSPIRAGQRQFPCARCGASLVFEPGTMAQICPYCGEHNQIKIIDQRVEEIDYAEQLLALQSGEAEMVDVLTVHCVTCGAESAFPPNITASLCPFCGAAIVATATSSRKIKPKSLLPFFIARKQADAAFKAWLAGRWFAPSDLKTRAERSGMNGAYLPHWTYDSHTVTDYTGQRGDDYTVSESYTTYENGRAVTRTRQVTKTRWTSVSGRVENDFDDVLIVATDSLPKDKIDKLEPWDLEHLVPYTDEFLGGFISQAYDVDLPTGFERAKQVMVGVIHRTICADIGGDHQVVAWTNTQYFDISFKHLLLPVWISAYRYHEASYRFLVNARTGEVQGERPHSWIKITLFILMCLMAVLLLFLIVKS